MATDNKSIKFVWRGIDKNKAKVSGEMTGANEQMVKMELRRKGIVPMSVTKAPKPLFGKGKTKVASEEISIFTRQLATMIAAGIPIVQSLDILEEGQTNEGLKAAINQIKTAVEGGSTLAKAFESQPDLFPPLLTGLIGAGEQAGALDNMLNRIAHYREKSESLKAKIKKALFYPVTVVVIALLISTGLLIFIVPQFASIFTSFGAKLPMPTQIVMNMSNFMVKYWWVVFGLLGGGVWFFFKRLETSESFAYKVDHFMITVKIIGPIMQKAAISRIASTLSTTFAAGMPMVDALNAVAKAAGNRVFTKAIYEVRDEVLTGQRMNIAMKKHAIFPPLVIQMVAVGEESGTLEFMLAKVAEFYDEQVDNAVTNLSTLMEPIIMVILGVLIGGLVVAMYLPIFKMGGVVGGHG